KRADYHNRIGFAQAAFAGGDVDRMRRLLSGCPEPMRGWEWDYLTRISDSSQYTLQVPCKGLSPALVGLAPGRLMYFKVNEDITVFDAATRGQLLKIVIPTGTVTAVMNADGSRMYAGNGTKLLAWDAVTGAMVKEVQIGPHLFVADITRDGKRVLIVGPDDQVQIRDVATGGSLV